MPRFLLFGFLVLSTVAWAGSFKVITFNAMLVCVGPRCILADSDDRVERTKKIGPWLKSQNAEFVFLQEIWNSSQYEEIFKASGSPYGHYFGPDLAILSKYPLEGMKHHRFRWQGAYQQDCKRLSFAFGTQTALAFAKLPNGRRLALGNSHTLPRWAEIPGFRDPSDIHTPGRQFTILELLDFYGRELKDEPFIWAGDFNMNQISDEYAFFMKLSGLVDTFREANRGSQFDWSKACTFCDFSPYVRKQKIPGEGILDYIMVSAKDFTPISSEILPETEHLSDHLAILTELRLNEGSSGLRRFARASTEDLARIRRYFEEVSISPWCRLAGPSGWFERRAAQEFLAAYDH
jgi:hypothetical protein